MESGCVPHQQQHAAVFLDGATAAQEAQHHDDHADGDHQVHARDRLTGQLRQTERGGRGGSCDIWRQVGRAHSLGSIRPSGSHLVVILVDLQVDGHAQDDATADLQPQTTSKEVVSLAPPSGEALQQVEEEGEGEKEEEQEDSVSCGAPSGHTHAYFFMEPLGAGERFPTAEDLIMQEELLQAAVADPTSRDEPWSGRGLH